MTCVVRTQPLRPQSLCVQVDSHQFSGFFWPAKGAAPPAGLFFIHIANALG